MPARGLIIQYQKRLWSIVVLRLLIDLAMALFMLAMVGLLAAGFFTLIGGGLGVSMHHVRRALGILGWVYVFMIWVRAFYRHWVIAGQAFIESTDTQSTVSEGANAQSSAPSN